MAVLVDERPRWLRRWLIGLNLGLLGAALIFATWFSRRGVFLAFLVPVAIVPFSYARWRLHATLARHLGKRPRVLALIAASSVLLDTVLVAQLLTGRSGEAIPVLHGPGVTWVGPVWFSAHAILFLSYAALALSRSAHGLAGRLRGWLERSRDPSVLGREPSIPSPERREFLQRAGLLGAGVPFFVSLSSVPLTYDLRVEEREIELPHWPPSLDGLRVAHLSDIHVGGGMNRERLLRMAELTNAARPDLVAHTGDFLTHRSGDFDAPLYEALALIRVPLGQWACLGNHDYDDPERFTRKLAAAGVTPLRDGIQTIRVDGQPLEIAGADYVSRHAPRRELYRGLAGAWGLRGDAPRLLLNHDPTSFDDLPDGLADLVLSGHTHGGHVGVQLGRDTALTVVGLVGLPDQGLFTHRDMRLFVTRCVGFYGYPMRVGIPPEIALLVIRAPRRSPITAA